MCSSLLSLPTAALATLPFAWADSAAAATVCFDVPDWLVDWKAALFHSPVVAVGTAGLALVLFPKLIRTAINYLAIPAILAMLAYAAVSFPEQTADSVYAVLEFVKEHPTASSIGIIVGAGALLGPDLLAGTAVAGVLVLLAAKLGILQMPQLPQLPKVPGLARQLNKAGDALRDRFDDLDDGFDDSRASAAAARQNKYSAALESTQLLGSSSSSSGGGGSSRFSRLQEVQSLPPSYPAAATAAESPARTQSAPPLATPQHQEQQQQRPAAAAAVEAASPGVAAFKGLAQRLGTTAKTLTTTALEGGKAAGGAVLQQGRQVLQQSRDSEAVQGLSQQTADAAGKAAQATRQLASGLWQRGQQLASPAGLQGLKQGAAAAVVRASEAVKGVKRQGGRDRLEEREQQQQQQQQGQPEPAVGAGAVAMGRSEQEVDAILANS